MFKQLRNKFLVLNMSIISALMITTFCVIYFITYSNIQSENVKKLNDLSASPQKVDVSLLKMGKLLFHRITPCHFLYRLMSKV